MNNALDNIQGFALGSGDQLDELNKALTVGYGTDSASFTGGDALRPQSLESSLKIVTFQSEHIRFWKDIPKMPAYSTVEEFNVLEGYGAGHGGFVNDGELPVTQDTTYRRNYALVRFLGTTREVTLGMTWIRPAHGDVVTLETKNGILWLLEKLERALFWGNSNVVTEEFDGLFTLLQANLPAGSENIIDLKGQPLDQTTMNLASRIIADNYGNATDFYGSYQSLEGLASSMYPKERIGASLPSADGTVGVAINKFVSQSGLINLKGDVFLKAGGAPPTAATNSQAPATPTIANELTPADTATKFTTGLGGVFYYKVTAVNRFGESAPVTSSAITIADGDKCTFEVSDGGGGFPATGFKIYRTEKSGASTTVKYIMSVARAAGGGATTVTDLNEWLPNCSHSLMLQNNTQSLAFKQLMPMVKLPLARISPSVRWMQLMAGTPVLYAPKKNCIIKNIGPYTGGDSQDV
jgi:hypothetical protein